MLHKSKGKGDTDCFPRCTEMDPKKKKRGIPKQRDCFYERDSECEGKTKPRMESVWSKSKKGERKRMKKCPINSKIFF
jgi:hypothetical protein